MRDIIQGSTMNNAYGSIMKTEELAAFAMVMHDELRLASPKGGLYRPTNLGEVVKRLVDFAQRLKRLAEKRIDLDSNDERARAELDLALGKCRSELYKYLDFLNLWAIDEPGEHPNPAFIIATPLSRHTNDLDQKGWIVPV